MVALWVHIRNRLAAQCIYCLTQLLKGNKKKTKQNKMCHVLSNAAFFLL